MLVSTAAPLGTARNDGADATDSAQAAAARGLRTLAELGGTGAFAVVTAGDHAYLGVGPRLVVIDIATPASPSWVAELRLPATPRALAMDADILYVADDEAGVRIIDVARPDAPREVAVVTRQGDALDIAVSNHTLYVVGGALGLVAIDVADPRTPRVLSETAALGGSAIAVVDGFVYVGQWAAITIVDVQDPTQPRVVGELTTPVDPELAAIGDIFVQGGVAYAALTEIGLWMVDVHQPSQPTSLAILPILNGATEVRVTGAQAVVTDGYRNLYVIDARAPSHAVVMGGYELWKATALALQGDLIAVSNGFSSLHLVDIADPTHPALKGVYTDPAPGYVHDVDVVRGTLWLLDSSRLLAYDVRQPAAPRLLGELAVPGGARRISVDGVRVYVTAQRHGLVIVDAQDPTRMREVGRYAAESGEWGVVGATAAGNTAFVVENGVLVTIDVSTPSTPVVLDRNFYLPMFGSLQEVVVKDGRAYVCSGAGGLTIFDVSDPSHLRMLGRTSNVSAEGVHVIGSTAYVAGVDLSIVDVAAPSEPRVLWRSGMGGGSQDVRVSDGLAYVADGPAGLTLFDVRDPATARELFALPLADGGWQIALAEHIAYVARGFDGLGVYETVDLEHAAYLPYAGSTDARRSAPPSRAGCPVYDAVPSALLSRASHPARGGCSGGSG